MIPFRRFVFVAIALITSGCKAGEERETGTDGSARWAYELALPHFERFGGDWELRQIIGSGVALDGRLGRTSGAWSFIGYSKARERVMQVTVDFTGKQSVGTRDQAVPGPAFGRKIPDGWRDSTEVLAELRPKLSLDATEVMLVSLNITDYGGVSNGVAVWAVSFNAGPLLIAGPDAKFLGAR